MNSCSGSIRREQWIPDQVSIIWLCLAFLFASLIPIPQYLCSWNLHFGTNILIYVPQKWNVNPSSLFFHRIRSLPTWVLMPKVSNFPNLVLISLSSPSILSSAGVNLPFPLPVIVANISFSSSVHRFIPRYPELSSKYTRFWSGSHRRIRSVPSPRRQLHFRPQGSGSWSSCTWNLGRSGRGPFSDWYLFLCTIVFSFAEGPHLHRTSWRYVSEPGCREIRIKCE